MNKYQKIENEASLSKNVESGAIVNTDKNAFETYLNIRNRRDSEGRRLDNLETELSEIKALLMQLLAK